MGGGDRVGGAQWEGHSGRDRVGGAQWGGDTVGGAQWEGSLTTGTVTIYSHYMYTSIAD